MQSELVARKPSAKTLHILSGLEIGGMERAVMRLASRAMQEGMNHDLLLYDKPFRSELLDFNPKGLTTWYLPRRPGIDFRFASRLAKRMMELEVGLAHAHNATAIFYSALAIFIGRLTETALIGTFRTRPQPGSPFARLLTRWAAGRATDITAVSQELNDWLMRSAWTRKCTTIWNGVDLAAFSRTGRIHSWRGAHGIPEDAIVIGHVGRFAPIKRHIDLFDAAAKLQSTDLPLYFAFAGAGPLFDHFRKRAAELRNVVMLRNVKDVSSFLRSLDIFVLCSEHEGAPQALLEAMACACAIVATRVGGIPQMLDSDGPTPAGRLVPPRQPDLLAAEILRLARDRELRDRLSRLAGKRAHAFSFDHEWAQYAALYRAAVQPPVMAWEK